MAKFQLKKQTKVIQDKSRATIKYAILGKGDLFGLQECQFKPNNPKLSLRQHTVTCVQNESKVIFINYAAFVERVLNDINTERDIKIETIVKQHFYESRSYQQQHTIWDSKLHSVEGASHPESLTEGQIRDKSPDQQKEPKKPKLRTVEQYYKEKFDSGFLSMIVQSMQERTSNSIAEGTPEFKKMVFQKSKEIQSYFDIKLNRNQPTARRRDPQSKLPPLQSQSLIDKYHHLDSQQNSIITSVDYERNASTGGVVTMRGDPKRSDKLQEDSILSTLPNDISAPQMTIGEDSLKYYSQDHAKDTRVLHSVVKQKMPGPDYQMKTMINQEPLGLMIQSDLTNKRNLAEMQSKMVNQDLAPIVNNQQYEGMSYPSSSTPINYNLEITNPTLQPQATVETKPEVVESPQINPKNYQTSIVVENDGQSPMKRGPLPSTQLAKNQSPAQPTVAQSLNNALEVKLIPTAELNEPEEKSEEKPTKRELVAKKSTMNKTQDQFNRQNKADLLVSESEQPSPDPKRETALNDDESIEAEMRDKKKYSMVTETKKDKEKPDSSLPPLQPLQFSPKNNDRLGKREPSITTQSPSHLGNIRDARYSQELKSNKKGRKPLLQGELSSKQIKEEGETISHEGQPGQGLNLPQVKNSHDLGMSLDESKDVNLPQRKGIQKHIRLTKLASPQHFSVESDDNSPQSPKRMQGFELLSGGTLPFDEQIIPTAQGLKGSKRSQIQLLRQQAQDRKSPTGVHYSKAAISQILQSQTSDANQQALPQGDIFNHSHQQMVQDIATAHSSGGFQYSQSHRLQMSQNNKILPQYMGNTGQRDLSQDPQLPQQQQQQVFVPSQINPRMMRPQLVYHYRNKRNATHTAGSHDAALKNDTQSKRKTKKKGAIFNSSNAPQTKHTRAHSSSIPDNSGKYSTRGAEDNQVPFGFRQPHTGEQYLDGSHTPERSLMQTASDAASNFDPNATNTNQFNLTPQAAAAATELIQNFIINPSQPITTQDFLAIQQKYELPPHEAYQLLLQQIQFQKALLQPPTAATVVKVSHQSYTTHVKQKREEVIAFRNDLVRRFTKVKRSNSNSMYGLGARSSRRASPNVSMYR